MKLDAAHAIYIFVNNKLHPTTSVMSEMYRMYKEEDGFMYLDVFHESTFG
jgi:GABA(A) receptor-associated protein